TIPVLNHNYVISDAAVPSYTVIIPTLTNYSYGVVIAQETVIHTLKIAWAQWVLLIGTQLKTLRRVSRGTRRRHSKRLYH
ncbi:hypothetical protein Hypma_010464, partial [Hypsizygus marmoreus]